MHLKRSVVPSVWAAVAMDTFHRQSLNYRMLLGLPQLFSVARVCGFNSGKVLKVLQDIASFGGASGTSSITVTGEYGLSSNGRHSEGDRGQY